MPQFKAVIRTNEHFKNVNGKYNVKIRISHKGQVRYIATEYYIDQLQIDTETGLVIKHPNAGLINIDIQEKLLAYQKQILKEGSRIDKLTCQQVKDLLEIKPEGELDFFQYADKVINSLWKEKRNGTADSYSFSIVNLKKYVPYPSLAFSQITPKFLKDFDLYMRYKGKSVNTIGIYLRSIRAIYNRAINDDLISINDYPFRKFKIKKEATIKRNLSIDEIILIRDMVLTGQKEKARDIFMLSFYLIGINMKDLLGVKYDGGDRFIYRRSKTKKPYSIKVFPEAKAIWQKYDNCITFGKATDYRWTIKLINDYISDLIKNKNITTYYSRHSWGSIAAELDIPKETISAALGHGSTSVTDVYINFILSKVDEANKKVIDALKKPSNFLEDFVI